MSTPKTRLLMLSSHGDLGKQGLLTKNHRGSSLEAKSAKRWFVSAGFYVDYYKSRQMTQLAGSFDLRNVSMLKMISDSEILVRIKDKGSDMRISFRDDPQAVSSWLRLWSSAVAEEALDPGALVYRDASLALKFNAEFAYMTPLFSTKSSASLYSPREAPSQPDDNSVQLDTPREAKAAAEQSATPEAPPVVEKPKEEAAAVAPDPPEVVKAAHSPTPPVPMTDQVGAAVKMQSSIRGKMIRDEMTEAERRETWLRCMRQFYRVQQDWDKMLEMCLTDAQRAEAEKLRLASTPKRHCFVACFAPKPAVLTAEEMRAKQFCAAIRCYDWTKAESLATSTAETKDVMDSRRRVRMMMEAKASGDIKKALELAITAAEQDMCRLPVYAEKYQ